MSVAIASAAAPSRRPMKPIPSPRVALTLSCRIAIAADRGGAVELRNFRPMREQLRLFEHNGRVNVLDRAAALGEHRDAARPRAARPSRAAAVALVEMAG